MRSAVIDLSALLVDNQARPRARTRVVVTIENSNGVLSVEDFQHEPRSLHRFTISNASLLGYTGKGDLSEEHITILALTCSLANPRVVFSPIHHQFLTSTLSNTADDEELAEVKDDDTAHLVVRLTIRAGVDTLLTSQITIDEQQFLSIASDLVRLKLSEPMHTGANRRANVRQAVLSYREATMSDDPIARYKGFYAALEKAINSDRDRSGSVFDTQAAAETGLSARKISEMRAFYNRVKHPSFSSGQWRELTEGNKRMWEFQTMVKQAADAVLQAKIKII
jgi:hypothetical protein